MKSYLIVLAALIIAPGVYAQSPTYTLEDLNSMVEFSPGSQDGQFKWWVDDVNYLSKQWFWYRVGNEGQEYSIDTLLMPKEPKLLDANFNDGNDVLSVRYVSSTNSFMVDLIFTLTGAPWGSQTSDLAETIIITNTGTTPLDFHFFQYVDLNLGFESQDTVRFMNDNTVRQTSVGGPMASETVITPTSSHREIDYVPNTLGRLNDTLPTTLNDFSGPLTGDVSWAYQWDVEIAPKMGFVISKDKQITPEPATVAFLAVGSLVILRRRSMA
jgi:hypothetical protein